MTKATAPSPRGPKATDFAPGTRADVSLLVQPQDLRASYHRITRILALSNTGAW